MTLKLLGQASSLLDGEGVYGAIFHYAMVFAFVGSAAIIFLYLWKKGRLDMDEEPKLQMMRDDEEESLKEEGKDV